MKRLTWLIANCHSVSLEANQHRSYYRSVEQEIADDRLDGDKRFRDTDPEVLEECARRNVLLELQIYPDTPVGFLVWYHYDPEALLSTAYFWAVRERGAPPASQPCRACDGKGCVSAEIDEKCPRCKGSGQEP